MTIEINVQTTPNPNAVKINTSQRIFEGSGSTSLKNGETTDHALAQALINIEGVDNIFGINDFVTISKKADADWDLIMPKVEEAFKSIDI